MMNHLKTYISKQLSHPSGWGGQLIVYLLNRENGSMNQLTLEQLELQKGQYILEIGFGGGDLIHRLLQTKIPLQITGIDPSSASMTVGRRRFKEAIASGQLSLYQSRAEATPFPDKTFDAIATVNTLYFWSNSTVVLKECRRLLKPGGKLAIAYNSKTFLEQNQMTQYGFQAYGVSDIETQMNQAEFTYIQTVSGESSSNGKFFCTCGILKVT